MNCVTCGAIVFNNHHCANGHIVLQRETAGNTPPRSWNKFSDKMTTYELASSVAVIKNLLLLNKINSVEAGNTLWDLIVEATTGSDDAHYVPGMSKTIDALMERMKI